MLLFLRKGGLKTEYNYIAILLTENCNARCKMCCDSRGEVKGHTLTIKELDIILGEIKINKYIETIGITGGEPMLYIDLIAYIFDYNYGRNIEFTIKTNGFWGKSSDKYKQFLKRYASIIQNISFSYDEFHKEFIDIENIKESIKLCSELKINTDIVACFLKNNMQPGDILNELGECAYLTRFLYQPVINTGTAKKLLDEKKFSKIIRCK